MDLPRQYLRRQNSVEAPVIGSPGHCDGLNEYDGRMGVRISAIFVIFFGSTIATLFPIFAKRHRGLGVPDWTFFIARYFGSGVIIATAFIHLLVPGREALTDECLTGIIVEYCWPEAIALMTIMLMFFLHLMTMRRSGVMDHTYNSTSNDSPLRTRKQDGVVDQGNNTLSETNANGANTSPDWAEYDSVSESYAAQLTSVFILEFGVIFHSIFIGLTLAVAGEEFTTLYIVLTFHQTFEGFGLGARLASVAWPSSKKWTPYILGITYGLSTSLAISIGLGVREIYSPGSHSTLVVNGVLDSISAGILIYTGLVELVAHDVVFNPYMRKGSQHRTWYAFMLMCLGAGLMALLGNWA